MFDSRFENRPAPDALDEVLEVAVMQSVFAAEQYQRVDWMRAEALADAARAGRRMTDVVERGIRLELAAALRITEYAAGALIGHAEALVHRYPSALDALAGGRITPRHAELLTDLLDEVEPHLRDDLLPQAVELAETQPVGVFRRRLRALVDSTRAVTLVDRHARALSERRVCVESAHDSMAWFMAFMPAVEAQASMNRLTGMGKRIIANEGETRTLDQVRADILGDLLIQGESPVVPAQARGVRAEVVVTVPALALLDEADSDGADAREADTRVTDARETDTRESDAGEADVRESDGGEAEARETVVDQDGTAAVNESNAANDCPARDSDATDRSQDPRRPRPGIPGELPMVEGLGPIPIDRARELCGGADGWMRALTHPETGMVLSIGRDRYRPPAALRRLVRWRAGRCMAPGCGMPASRCEIDHSVAWEDGGHTCLDNHAPLCKGHHLVKHHSGWTLRQCPDSGGAVEWTSPAGRRYLVEPERRVPTFSTTLSTAGAAPGADPPF